MPKLCLQPSTASQPCSVLTAHSSAVAELGSVWTKARGTKIKGPLSYEIQNNCKAPIAQLASTVNLRDSQSLTNGRMVLQTLDEQSPGKRHTF